jgi:hypothetical protein
MLEGDEDTGAMTFTSSQRASLPKNLQKPQTRKEIVSAMVRLNSQGLSVPVTLPEARKLPVIPNTRSRAVRQQGLSTLGSQTNLTTLHSAEHCSNLGAHDKFVRNRNRYAYERSHASLEQEDQSEMQLAHEDESITVFDLVHRGR